MPGSNRVKLSLILCSRNDSYQGNSRWRLQTTLNYLAKKVDEVGRLKDVEVVLSDWGSQVPLQEVLELTPEAAELTRFLHIPHPLAKEQQKDSPFPEVLALNAAARRAQGEYIGRIDQDILVGKRFLRAFFQMYAGVKESEAPIESAILFSSRRSIPYSFAARCPAFWAVEAFVDTCGNLTPLHDEQTSTFWVYSVGIFLLHRRLWEESGGYNERMIYFNGMESEMILRLKQKYLIANLGKRVGFDFYHLDHVPHPFWKTIRSFTDRKTNSFSHQEPIRPVFPNAQTWGLSVHPLELKRVAPKLSAADLSTQGQERASVIRDKLAIFCAGILVLFLILKERVDSLLERYLWASSRELRGKLGLRKTQLEKFFSGRLKR